MKKRLRNVVVAAILMVLSSWTLGAQDTVKWLLLDVPPSIILEGPYRGQGNLDRIHQFFASHLPSSTHETFVSNIARVTSELQGTSQVASPGLLLTPDREKQFWVSIPEAITPANMLIVRPGSLPALQKFIDSRGEVEIASVLASGLQVGVATGRHYGNPVDDLLLKYKGSPNLFFRGASDVSEGLVKMLLTQRLDAVLLFPFEAQYIARQFGDASNLTSVPISGMPSYSVTVAVAPRTPWGAALIEKLNGLIRANRLTFAEYLTPWLDDSANKLYHRWLADFLAKNP